ncbi:MAG: LytTR family transcriptional regulator DNA-binding domain-containing protein [Paenibacillaceae bacterium]
MQIPVTRDRKNQTDIIMLDMNDVLYMHMDGHTVVYHTMHEHFYHLMPSLAVLSRHVQELGFEKLDRINLVNLHKIEHFDEKLGIVYFQQEHEVTKKSKSATVAFLNKVKLKNRLLKNKKL